ncbi:MAG: hypothetical protein R2711_09870 [Acidimicrobiales bacterium]
MSEGRRPGVLSRLYHGETDFDIVGRWKLWFTISGLLVAIGLGALFANGLNLGIDFTGGTVWEVPAGKADVADVESAVRGLGYDDVQVQEVTQATGDGNQRILRVEAEATASPTKATTAALEGAASDLDAIAADLSGASKRRVDRVVGQLEGIEGPFRTDVDELATLQDEIDALAQDLDGTSGDARPRSCRMRPSPCAARSEALATASDGPALAAVGRAVTDVLAEQTGSKASEVTVDTVGPSAKGQQISAKARTALIVFLIVIALHHVALRVPFAWPRCSP